MLYKNTVYLYILFLFCTTQLAFGQIKVLNSQTGEPLSGANIYSTNKTEVYVTDVNGHIYQILPEGRYTVSHIGFKSTNIQIENTSNEKTIWLEPNFQLLKEVEVRGYENNASYLSVAGSYGLINQDAISSFGQHSLVRAVNTLPGIRMEERSPQSYRISIRGSLLRAPYGVRNVKVYWNDIPYTDPTGNAFLYFLDNENVSDIEVIKGPAGSVYGAGMGGVLLLNSRANPDDGFSGSIGMDIGSYGFRNVDLAGSYNGEDIQSTVRYAHSNADGYREHTAFDKDVFQVQNIISTSEKNKLSISLLYAGLFYELPGGLTQEQLQEDRRQARPASVDQNAYVDHRNLLAGINNHHFWDSGFGNSTSLYLSNGIKENPFITNYELEKTDGLGGRTRFYKNIKANQNDLTLSLGGEYQYGKFHASNHDNDNGYAGALRYEDESKINNGFVFGQAEFDVKGQWVFTAGASVNYLKYDINRLRDVALDSSYQLVKEFEPVFSPRIGIVKRLNENTSLHASISQGFSPPTQEEIRTSDGDINDDIEAEKGVNYEIGFRGNTNDGKLMFDLTAFYMNQLNTIVSRTTDGGVSKFENSGSTNQSGIEALLGWQVISDAPGLINNLRIQSAYTFHHFRFDEYQKDESDFSGNELTGTAPHILVTTIDVKTKPGAYLFLSHNFTDAIPLNDENTVYSKGYNLVTLKVGWQPTQKKNFDIYFGIDNLLDEEYSLGNDLNAFGDRYFEPSPERNYYAGLKFHF